VTQAEKITVDIINPNGEKIAAQILVWEVAPQSKEKVKLILKFAGRQLHRTDTDLFHALVFIRQELEKDNLLLNCYGASKHVYPSAMAINMGAGEMAYKLTLGKKAKTEDLVSIFDVGADIVPATVNQQKDFYNDWLRSLNQE